MPRRERDIRAIYQASIANLGKAMGVFERVRVYDSTAEWTEPRLVASAHDGKVTRHGTSPTWLERALSAQDS
jgi:predicted ABC-type ATPase